MKKPFKVLSASAVATAMAVTALVPVASADVTNEVPSEAKVLDYIHINHEGQVIKVSTTDYTQLLGAERVKGTDVKFVQVKEGSIYTVLDYIEMLGLKETIPSTLEALYKAKKSVEQQSPEAELDKDGKLVIKDEQPEDRLNETFFYNVA